MLSLLRDILHIRCESIPPGGDPDTSDWICSDGIGYILPGGVFAVVALVLTVVGMVGAVGVLRRPRRLLVNTATVGVSAVVVGTFFLSLTSVGSVPAGASATGFWVDAVLPAGVICVAAVVVVRVGPRRKGWVAFALLAVGAGLLVVAIFVQPGLIMALAPAAGVVAAAAAVPVDERVPEAAPAARGVVTCARSAPGRSSTARRG